MKRYLSALLALALLTSFGALALTGEEALGLADDSNNSYKTLQLGSRDGDDNGASVVILQNRLQELGYLPSAADGQFGKLTEVAVINFQETNGLTVTGIADDSTQTLLFSGSALHAAANVAKETDIFYVQQALINWGFMTGSADGIAGEATETAVADFKNYVYNTYAAQYAAYATAPPTPEPTLSPDEMPIADDTPYALMDFVASNGGQDGKITDGVVKFAKGEYTFRPYAMTLQKGMEGIEVWRLQRRLNKLRYLYKPDGSYGSLTEYALQYFQRRNGLEPTGVADQATQELLFSPNAVSSEEYVFPYKIFVYLDSQTVEVYGWDGKGYNKRVGSFKCSSGMRGYDTPTGTYQSGGKVTAGKWYYFSDYNCYAKYAYRVVGGIMFHSCLYNSKKQGPTHSSVAALGRKASHGCMRLAENNAQWIFENCPEGTTVVIKNSK